MPYTKTLGSAHYVLDVVNEYIANRGTYWEAGGDLTLGASSTNPIVNIGAVTVRISEEEYSTGSESEVVLAANNGSTPRKDLIVAEVPASGDPADPPDVHAIAGDPIEMDGENGYNAITDENGNLVADPPALPEVQPPAGTNLKDVAVPLHIVYVPPGTADSTDLPNNGTEDVRKEGVGVSDVLRTGDAVQEIEGHPETIDATASNAEQLGGKNDAKLSRDKPNLILNATLGSGNSSARRIFRVPDGYQLRITGMGSSVFPSLPSASRAQIQDYEGGDWTGHTSTDSQWNVMDNTKAGPMWFGARIVNIGDSQQTIEARFSFTIEPIE